MTAKPTPAKSFANLNPVPPKKTASRGFGVYVHWPFCLSKCPYCDFNSHVAGAPVEHQRFLRALCQELSHFSARSTGQTVTSIFFGGGTPSLMAPETVAGVIDHIAGLWPLAADVEITLEANPTSVEAARFKAFKSAGVNRVSLGLQALNDSDLKALGRTHSADEGRAALGIAADVFERFSFDLIYARSRQTLADWEAELNQALGLAGDHLSLYQLTIEPETPFARFFAAGKLAMPSETLAGDFYDLTQDICDAAGLPAYEISNHAKPQGASRHNLTYWRYGDYVGVGPGAHGRVSGEARKIATQTEKEPMTWLSLVEKNGHGLVAEDSVTQAQAAEELLLMGLRLSEGVSLIKLKALGWQPPEQALRMLQGEGLMVSGQSDRLQATKSGRLVLNAVLAALLA